MLLDSFYSVASLEAHSNVSPERASVVPYGCDTTSVAGALGGNGLVIAPLIKAWCSEETSAR